MDAVIVWTDVEVKEYRRSRLRYLKDNPGTQGYQELERSRAEFLISLGAAIRNISDLRRVFVLSAIKTEIPDNFLEENFPGKDIELRSMTFDQLFCDGMEGFLPCFSAIAAMTLLYRANALEDSFLLLNIGCIPIQKTDIQRFISNGKPAVYGEWKRSDAISGKRKQRIFIPGPLPILMRRKTMEECLTSHPGLMTANLRHHLDSPRSKQNPDGQTDIRLLIANSLETEKVGISRRRRNHGTMILGLDPCDDRSFFEAIGNARDAEFIEIAPLKDFSPAQRLAIIDFLCHLLQIRLP